MSRGIRPPSTEWSGQTGLPEVPDLCSPHLSPGTALLPSCPVASRAEWPGSRTHSGHKTPCRDFCSAVQSPFFCYINTHPQVSDQGAATQGLRGPLPCIWDGSPCPGDTPFLSFPQCPHLPQHQARECGREHSGAPGLPPGTREGLRLPLRLHVSAPAPRAPGMMRMCSRAHDLMTQTCTGGCGQHADPQGPTHPSNIDAPCSPQRQEDGWHHDPCPRAAGTHLSVEQMNPSSIHWPLRLSPLLRSTP